MNESQHATARTVALTTLAVIASVVALYLGREILVPIAFAVALAIFFRPIPRWLVKWYIPAPATAAIIVLGLVACLIAGTYAMVGPVEKWANDLPQRFQAAEEKLQKLRQPVKKATEVAQQIERATQGPSTAPSPTPAPPGPGVLSRVMGQTTRLLAEVVEALLLLYLLLASGDLFHRKLQWISAVDGGNPRAADGPLIQVERAVQRYIGVTALINLVQAGVVMLVLWALKMPGVWIWGLLTFFLEFVPYLGATVMVALLSVSAFTAFDSLGHILMVPGSYLVITTLQNNVASPIAYGQSLKLNPVAVLIGVLLWWLIWGIPGAFLAVPLTAAVKIIADQTELFKPVGELLGE